jgi:hypothetical protein
MAVHHSIKQKRIKKEEKVCRFWFPVAKENITRTGFLEKVLIISVASRVPTEMIIKRWGNRNKFH